MLTCTLNGDEGGLENVYTRVAADLHFPSYFGRNLDALYDCLTDVKEARVVWNNSDQAKRRLGENFPKLVEIFEDVAKFNPNFKFERS